MTEPGRSCPGILAAKQNITGISRQLRDEILSRMEKDTIDRLRVSADPRKGFARAAGRDLAKRLGAEAAGVPVSGIRLEHEADGKPFLLLGGSDGFRRLPLSVSLSHSASWLLAAVSDRPVACDVQQRRHFPLEAVRGFFSEEDMRSIRSAQDPDQELCRIWCRRECFIKLFGVDRFSVRIPLCDTGMLRTEYGVSLFEECKVDAVCLALMWTGEDIPVTFYNC